MNFDETDLGKIEVSDAVIRDIAIHSFLEFVKGSPKDGKARKEARNAVGIDVIDDEESGKVVRIAVKTKVKYGISIPDFGRKLQEKLKSDVETFSGLSVDEISIDVEDVYEEPEVIKEPEEEPEEEREEIEIVNQEEEIKEADSDNV